MGCGDGYGWPDVWVAVEGVLRNGFEAIMCRFGHNTALIGYITTVNGRAYFPKVDQILHDSLYSAEGALVFLKHGCHYRPTHDYIRDVYLFETRKCVYIVKPLPRDRMVKIYEQEFLPRLLVVSNQVSAVPIQ